jgi:hypothetical protein
MHFLPWERESALSAMELASTHISMKTSRNAEIAVELEYVQLVVEQGVPFQSRLRF